MQSSNAVSSRQGGRPTGQTITQQTQRPTSAIPDTYAFTMLGSHFDENARIWDSAKAPWREGMNHFFAILERYSLLMKYNRTVDTIRREHGLGEDDEDREEETDGVSRGDGDHLESSDSDSDSQRGRTTQAANQPSTPSKDPYSLGIRIIKYHSKTGNTWAYKWYLDFPTPNAKSQFELAIGAHCKKMTGLISELRGEQAEDEKATEEYGESTEDGEEQGSKGKSGKKNKKSYRMTKGGVAVGFHRNIALESFAPTHRFIYSYLLLVCGKEEYQMDDVCNSYGYDWKDSNVKALFSNKAAEKVLKNNGYEIVKNIDPVYCDRGFFAGHYANTALPHVKPEETYLINRLREVEWKDPLSVPPLLKLLSKEESVQIPRRSPEQGDGNPHNCDSYHYIRAFLGNRLDYLDKKLKELKTTFHHNAYIELVKIHQKQVDEVMEIMMNPFAPREITDKLPPSSTAILEYLKKNYDGKTGKYNLFGTPSIGNNKNQTSSEDVFGVKITDTVQDIEKTTSTRNKDALPDLNYIHIEDWEADNEFLNYIQMMVYATYMIQSGLEDDVNFFIIDLFGSYSAFDSFQHTLFNVWNDGLPGCGKSELHRRLKSLMIIGTYRESGADSSKQAAWTPDNDSDLTLFIDESSNNLSRHNTTDEAETHKKNFKMFSTENKVGRKILSTYKRVDGDGNENNIRKSHNWNIYNISIRYENSNVSNMKLELPIRQRFNDQHSERIETTRILASSLSKSQKKFSVDDSITWYSKLMKGIQTGAWLSHKSMFIGMVRRYDDVYPKMIITHILIGLQRKGFNIADIRKVENILRLVIECNIGYSWFKTCCLTPKSDEEMEKAFIRPEDVKYTGINWGKQFERKKFLLDATHEQNFTLQQIVFGTSLLFETLADERIRFLRRVVFEDILGLTKGIQQHCKVIYDVMRKYDFGDVITPNYDYDLFTIQNRVEDPKFKKRIGFKILDNISNSQTSLDPNTGEKSEKHIRTSSVNPYSNLPPDTLVNPNYISIYGNNLNEISSMLVVATSGTTIQKSYDVSQMIIELTSTYIIPKHELEYIEYHDLAKKTESYLGSSGLEGSINEDGSLAVEDKMDEDGNPIYKGIPDEISIFKQAKHGKPYHESRPNEIYKKKKKVPLVIYENNGMKGVVLSIHIEMARMVFYRDFEEIIRSLSCYTTKEVNVPTVTRDGYQIIKIPKIAEGVRVAIQLPEVQLSKTKGKSSKLRKDAKIFIQSISDSHSKSMKEFYKYSQNTQYGYLLASSRYSMALESGKTELLLPLGVSADDFFRQIHLEVNGFDDEPPLWLTNNKLWEEEKEEEKKSRMDSYPDSIGLYDDQDIDFFDLPPEDEEDEAAKIVVINRSGERVEEEEEEEEPRVNKRKSRTDPITAPMPELTTGVEEKQYTEDGGDESDEEFMTDLPDPKKKKKEHKPISIGTTFSYIDSESKEVDPDAAEYEDQMVSEEEEEEEEYQTHDKRPIPRVEIDEEEKIDGDEYEEEDFHEDEISPEIESEAYDPSQPDEVFDTQNVGSGETEIVQDDTDNTDCGEEYE